METTHSAAPMNDSLMYKLLTTLAFLSHIHWNASGQHVQVSEDADVYFTGYSASSAQSSPRVSQAINSFYGCGHFDAGYAGACPHWSA